MKNFKFLATIVIVQVFLGIILFSSAYAMWGGGGVEPPEIIIPPDPSPSPIIDVNKDVKEEYIDINGQHLLAQKVTTTTITGDGFSTKTTAVVSFAYDENGNLVDAKGTQHSETINSDGSKSVSDTQEQYTVKDGQALLSSSKTIGESFDATGAKIGDFSETKDYNYELIGGNWQLMQTVSTSKALNIDGSSEVITRTTSYQRDANGQITGVTQIAAGERKTVVGVDASGNKEYRTQELQDYQATFAYDVQEGWYLSMEAYTWVDKPSADKLLGDLNGDAVVDISDVILVQRQALGLDPMTKDADIDQNGVVDLNDAISTLRLALGLELIGQQKVLGDLNGDAVVDISDVILVLRQAKGIDPMTKDADIDQNGVVDINDTISTLRLALGLELIDKQDSLRAAAINFLAQSLDIDANGIKVVNMEGITPHNILGYSATLITLVTSEGETYFVKAGTTISPEAETGFALLNTQDVAGIISGLDIGRAVNILSNMNPEVAAQILTAQEPIYYIAGEQTTTIYPAPMPPYWPASPIISPTQAGAILSAMNPEQAAKIIECFFMVGDPENLQLEPLIKPVSEAAVNIIKAIPQEALDKIIQFLDPKIAELVREIVNPTPEGQAIQFLANYLGIDPSGIKVLHMENITPEGLFDANTFLITLTASTGEHYFLTTATGMPSPIPQGFNFTLLNTTDVAQIISGLDIGRAVNILSNMNPKVAAQILTAQEPIWYIAEPTTTIYPRPVPMPTYPIISPTQSAQILSAMSPEQAAAIVTCFFRQGKRLEMPGDIVSIPEKPVLQRPNPVSPIVKDIIRALDRIDHKAMRLILRHLDRETFKLVMAILRQRLPIIRIDGPLPLHTAGV